VKRLMVLTCLIVPALAGCAGLRDPMEPVSRADNAGYHRPASPFWDATRPADNGTMPEWGERSSEERDAWRARHR